MASQIMKAADEVIAQLITLSTAGAWSAEVTAEFGDWAATQAPEISYNATVERKDLTVGQLAVYVGFDFRELHPDAHDRCSMSHIYPVGIGVYQRFRAPGTDTASGINEQISRSTIDLHLQFVEELQDLLYENNLTSFHSHSVVEAAFNQEAIKKQYLESVMIANYTAR